MTTAAVPDLGPRFTAVLAENRPAVEWEFRPGLTTGEYEAELPRRPAGGWVPRSVVSAETDAGPRYTVVWVRPPAAAK